MQAGQGAWDSRPAHIYKYKENLYKVDLSSLSIYLYEVIVCFIFVPVLRDALSSITFPKWSGELAYALMPPPLSFLGYTLCSKLLGSV